MVFLIKFTKMYTSFQLLSSFTIIIMRACFICMLSGGTYIMEFILCRFLVKSLNSYTRHKNKSRNSKIIKKNQYYYCVDEFLITSSCQVWHKNCFFSTIIIEKRQSPITENLSKKKWIKLIILYCSTNSISTLLCYPKYSFRC